LKEAVEELQPMALDKLFKAQESVNERAPQKFRNGDDIYHTGTNSTLSSARASTIQLKKATEFATDGNETFTHVIAGNDAPSTPISIKTNGFVFADPKKRRSTNDSLELSPCSKFVKEWYERKTIRRSNRKKGRTLLKPISYGSASATNSGEGDDEKSNDLQGETNIVDPPKIHSVVHKESSLIVGDGLIDASRECPPLRNVTCKTPSLCYTPASEDNSFFDDYW
jgi:hypothetical protein